MWNISEPNLDKNNLMLTSACEWSQGIAICGEYNYISSLDYVGFQNKTDEMILKLLFFHTYFYLVICISTGVPELFQV